MKKQLALLMGAVMAAGLFSEQGEKGSLDMITGEETQGYEVIINKWNELHPNVHLGRGAA